MTVQVRVVDRECHCRDCERRTRATYYLAERCGNCGSRWVAIYRKGDKAQYMAECPECGCGPVLHGTTAEALGMLSSSRAGAEHGPDDAGR